MEWNIYLSGRLCFACVLLCGLVIDSRGCFIRNCPPGGKRSMGIMSRATHECASCGPGMRGQCVGPSTCCGDFGCLMGTEDSRVCTKEDDDTEPCLIRGKSCGTMGQGNCVAEGLCCDAYACSYNSKCRVNSGKEEDQQILSLLNRLLHTGDYTD